MGSYNRFITGSRLSTITISWADTSIPASTRPSFHYLITKSQFLYKYAILPCRQIPCGRIECLFHPSPPVPIPASVSIMIIPLSTSTHLPVSPSISIKIISSFSVSVSDPVRVMFPLPVPPRRSSLWTIASTMATVSLPQAIPRIIPPIPPL